MESFIDYNLTVTVPYATRGIWLRVANDIDAKRDKLITVHLSFTDTRFDRILSLGEYHEKETRERTFKVLGLKSLRIELDQNHPPYGTFALFRAQVDTSWTLDKYG